jgi:hypothetical protein
MSRTAWIVIGGVAAVALILAIALVIVIAGDDDESEAVPRPALGAAPQVDPQAMQDFQDCLRDHGVELPDPGAGPPAAIRGAGQAFEACRDKLPEGVGALGGSGSPGLVVP